MNEKYFDLYFKSKNKIMKNPQDLDQLVKLLKKLQRLNE
jgi:hypothetical protein